jgi:hypothetical protein
LSTPNNLVASDVIWRGECYNDSEFITAGSALTISGQTTDATRYIVLTCATGQSFKDNANVRSNALTYNAANGVAIRDTAAYAAVITCTVANTQFIGLQVSGTGTSVICLTLGSGTNCLAQQCIFVGKGNAGDGVVSAAGGGTHKAINCLIVVQSNAYFGVSFGMSCYGCTIVNTGTAGTSAVIISSTAVTVFKNCAFFRFSTFLSSGTAPTSETFDATDLAAPTSTNAANDTNSLVFANQFASTVDLRALSTSGLNVGTPDSTNTPTDITGTTRSASTPYCGCWEYVSVVGNPYSYLSHTFGSIF